jgi:hypothetical protein
MPSDEYKASLNAFMSNMTDVEMSDVIHRLQTAEMSPEERDIKRVTRRLLMKLSNWALWDGAFDAQLDVTGFPLNAFQVINNNSTSSLIMITGRNVHIITAVSLLFPFITDNREYKTCERDRLVLQHLLE